MTVNFGTVWGKTKSVSGPGSNSADIVEKNYLEKKNLALTIR